MSAPIRKQVEAHQVRIAEAVRPDQSTEQPTPADSDLTMKTPRMMFSDQLIPGHLGENPGTLQENEHASARPRVVRTLKNPPEIWDLVHETPPHFNPGGAFVARLTSSKTKLILAMMGVMLITGLAAFTVMRLSDGRLGRGAAAQVQEASGISQRESGSQPSDTPRAPESAPVNTAVNTSPSDTASAPESALNTPVNTSPGAESVADNTAPQSTAPLPTVPSPDNGAFAGQALTYGIEPTGVSEGQAQANGPVVNNISKRTASHAGRTAAWSRNKRVTVASELQNGDTPGHNPADNPRPVRGASPAPRSEAEAGAKPQTSQASQPLDLKRRYEKNSSDSASANKGSSPTLSPQLIAPPTTTSAPRAKVIQWP